MSSSHSLILFIFIICATISLISCSAGDTSKVYKACVDACLQESPPPSFHWLWNLRDECKYQCMWQIEEERASKGAEPLKYFGKWPFRRFIQFQEFFSSLFSLFNIVPHIYFLLQMWELGLGLHEVYGERQTAGDEEDKTAKHKRGTKSTSAATELLQEDVTTLRWLMGIWRGYAFASINAWFWSFVFHARDTFFTERMDYFSACFTILYGTYAAFVTTVYPQRPSGAGFNIFLIFILFFVRHIYKMHFIKFDYGYNMTVNIVLSVAFTTMWILYAVKRRKEHPSAWKFIVASVGLVLASMLEIFDFPPMQQLVDAHAMWHLVTPPLGYIYYQGLLDVVFRRDAVKRDKKKQKSE